MTGGLPVSYIQHPSPVTIMSVLGNCHHIRTGSPHPVVRSSSSTVVGTLDSKFAMAHGLQLSSPLASIRPTQRRPSKIGATSDANDASRHYLNLFSKLNQKQQMEDQQPDLEWIVRKFCPLLIFHPEERYLCSNEEYYVDSTKLDAAMDDAPAHTIMEQLQKQLRAQKMKEKQEKENKGQTDTPTTDTGLAMDLVHRKDRIQTEDMKLSDIPMYAKARKGKLPSGEDIVDIYYFALMAYSGPSRVFFGAHAGDCEQISVRCTTDGRLISVYYGAHGEQDGIWLQPQQCPVDGDTGRLMGFVGLNGHGIFPTAGVQRCSRAFFLADDVTSSKGRVWGCKECLLLGYPDEGVLQNNKILLDNLQPIASDRGCEHTAGYTGEVENFSPALMQTRDEQVNIADIKVMKYNLLGQQKRVNAVLRCARKSATAGGTRTI